MKLKQSAALIVITAWGLVNSATFGQTIGSITSVTGGDVRFVGLDGSDRILGVGDLDLGSIRIAEQAQIMAVVSSAGAVVIVNGPADADVDERAGTVSLDLKRGSASLATAAGDGRANVRLVVGEGSTTIEFDAPATNDMYDLTAAADGMTSLAYWSGKGFAKIDVRAGGKSMELLSGQRLTLIAGEATISNAGQLSTAAAERLSIAACRIQRTRVEENLFVNIVAWDRFAGADAVVPQLSAGRVTPEIRQVTTQVTNNPNNTQRGNTTQARGFAGANAVPIVSPASLVVQGAGDQPLAVIENNTISGGNLSLTGSRGLGFGGLSLLSIPGFSPGGIRSIGPAGLGAR